MKKILTGLALTFLTCNASADLSYDEFHRLLQIDSDLAETYITGLAEGMHYANAMLTVQDRERLYCVPEGLSLNGESYIELVDSFVKDTRQRNQLGILLMLQFQNVFPCE